MSFSPQYTISNKVLINVANAEASKQIIDNSPLVPQWERSFQNQAIIRTIHHSTAIEGNELEMEDAEKVTAGKEVDTYRIRDLKEIVNYRKVIEYISKVKKKKLSMDLLLSVQKRLGKGLLPEKYLGKVRKENAVIVNSKTGEVVFDAPDKDELNDELLGLIKWDKDSKGSVHPLLRAGILHFELVRIHPFADLNGRTARIITTWSLYRDNFDIKKLFSLEEYYDQNTKLYYDALNSAHSGDLTEWLEYFAYGVSVELFRVRKEVLSLSMDQRLKHKLGQIALNERQIEIIKYIEENDQLKNPDFDLIFDNISDDTILRDLKDLIEKRIIKKLGRTKAARYILSS